jgi:hypothetical protein
MTVLQCIGIKRAAVAGGTLQRGRRPCSYLCGTTRKAVGGPLRYRSWRRSRHAARGPGAECCLLRIVRNTRTGGPFKPCFGLSGGRSTGRQSLPAARSRSCGPLGFNLDASLDPRRVMAKTAPLPVIRALTQPALHWIALLAKTLLRLQHPKSAAVRGKASLYSLGLLGSHQLSQRIYRRSSAN